MSALAGITMAALVAIAFTAGLIMSMAHTGEQVERTARRFAEGSMEYGYACAERQVPLERCRANLQQAMTPK